MKIDSEKIQNIFAKFGCDEKCVVTQEIAHESESYQPSSLEEEEKQAEELNLQTIFSESEEELESDQLLSLEEEERQAKELNLQTIFSESEEELESDQPLYLEKEEDVEEEQSANIEEESRQAEELSQQEIFFELKEEEDVEEYLPPTAEDEAEQAKRLEKFNLFSTQLTQEQDAKEHPVPKSDEKSTKSSNPKPKTHLESVDLEKSEYKLACEIIKDKKLAYIDNPSMGASISKDNERYWETISKQELKGIIYKHIPEKEKHEKSNIDGYCKNIAEFIRYEAYRNYFEKKSFEEDSFQKIENHVVFKNGVYDAKNGKLHPFNTKLPYYYGINANYIDYDEDTPYYDKLKEDATDGDHESMEMFDLMLAYLMIPNRSGKCFFVMANAPDSGKSLLGRFISDIYEGNRTKSIDPEHLSGRFSLGDASEFVLLSCLEMNTDRLKKPVVALMKQMTGDKTMRSEAKYKNEQTVNIRFKLLLATNGGITLPQGMQDAAFYRRIIVIPFIKQTPLDELQSNLDKKIWEERDAILSKCIRKLQKYIDENDGIVFPESSLSMSMKEAWMGGKNYDDEFLEKAIKYTGDKKDKVSINDIEKLYRMFIDISNESGGDVIITDRKNLVAKILSLFTSAEKSKGRVKSIFNPVKEKNEAVIKRIKVEDSFLELLGIY